MRVARRVRIVGLVQGVGFRPFVYRIAVLHGLVGYVLNLGGSEVEVWVEGDEREIEGFLRDLYEKKPPPARIEEVYVEEVEPKGFSQFEIRRSGRRVYAFSQIPPDFGMCEHCLREVLDPSSRWYRYPFNSCAWCGPRFSMIYAVPYDRGNTAMRDFPLCSECLREYEDPGNVRRFHAQGISCPKCGPRLTLVDPEGRRLPGDPIAEAARLVDRGYGVAVKGVGGFHLAALATDDEVVRELRRRKRRPQKPFALMALDEDVVREIAAPTEAHLELMRGPERPIVLVPKRPRSPVSDLVAPGLGELGVMLAYTPLHYLLLSETRDKFLIMTSGNPPGLPIVKDNREALEKLRGIADYFLLHNREIVNRVDDSVVRLTDREPMLIRRARGYAPAWFKLPFKLRRRVMALGAMLVNTGAVGFDRYVVPTQYVGDCDRVENLEFLEQALEFLRKAYRLKPEVVVSDAHPRYPTTLLAERMAGEEGVPHVKVQHHHAHVASAMASNKLPLDSEVLGIAIDGVGYGLDGTVWGGEALYASYTRFDRVAHLEYLPLPGGDAATERPARILVGFLAERVGEEEALEEARRLGLVEKLPGGEVEARIAARQAPKAPRCSSMGRFLDAVSALLGVCWLRTYEGEPAMRLEAAARGGGLVGGLRMEYEERDGRLVVLTGEFIESLIELVGREPVRDLAYTAQYLAGKALAEAGLEASGARIVVVSGGAAVNDYIVKGIKEAAQGRAKVLMPNGVPAGDGGISLGQVLVAGLLG